MIGSGCRTGPISPGPAQQRGGDHHTATLTKALTSVWPGGILLLDGRNFCRLNVMPAAQYAVSKRV